MSAELAALAAQRRAEIAALSGPLTPELLQGSTALGASWLPPDLHDGVQVESDISYGSHERHLLDVYTPEQADETTGRPVLVFVHGGGFVAGDKAADGSPFYGNVGAWAVHSGYVGVAMTYRLAPENRWPGGAEDIAQALTWVVEHIADHGGDPGRIVLVGQSAGAMHVADYVVRPELHGPHGSVLAGAALISCLYDVGGAEDRPMHRAYWGEDLDAWQHMGTVDGLIETDLPLFLAVAEYDDPQFLDHAGRLVTAWHQRRGDYPPMHYLDGQNHLTTVYGIGSDADVLGPALQRFVAAHTA